MKFSIYSFLFSRAFLSVFSGVFSIVTMWSAGSAFAAGEFVGMKATYDVYQVDKNGNSKQFVQDLEIVSFHQDINKYLIVNKSTYSDGYWESVEYFIETDWVLTQDQIRSTIEGCENAGNSLETIQTLAGEFQTCRLAPEENITNWVGFVPFGLVKATFRERDGSAVTSVIRAFSASEGETPKN